MIGLSRAAFFLLALTAILELPRRSEAAPNFELHGESRVRLEANSFFQPAGSANNENEYTFWGIRNRLSVKGKEGPFTAFLEAQDTRLVDLPEESNAATGGPLGTGAIYSVYNQGPDDKGQTFINQGYLKLDRLPWPGGSVRAGRFQYAVGNEILPEDPGLRWLKSARIAERLVGPFDWTHVGRRFDGAQAVAGSKAQDWIWNATLTASHPTQGGFNLDGGEPMPRVGLVTFSATVRKGKRESGIEASHFYIYYQDERDVVVVDNRPASLRPSLEAQPLAIHTWGGHLLGWHDLGPGRLDALTWFAIQTGQWTDLAHRAWAYAAEGGYQLRHCPWTPWLRAGWFHSSGDGDATDGTHRTFFQILPTARIYALNPFYNLMNNEDLFVSLQLKPDNRWSIRTEWHDLWLSNRSDSWYYGGGAQSNQSLFGFSARSSGGKSHLASTVDAQVNYVITKWLSGSVYYSHVFGGGAVDGLFAAHDQADYAYLEMTAKF